MSDQCVLKGMAVYNGNGTLDNTCHTNLMICDWCNRQVCGAHGAETYYEVGLKVSCDECIAQNKLFDINGNSISARRGIMLWFIEFCIQTYPSFTKAARK